VPSFLSMEEFWCAFFATIEISIEDSSRLVYSFLQNEITEDLLGDLDHGVLIMLGVCKVGHRIKIIKLANALLTGQVQLYLPGGSTSEPTRDVVSPILRDSTEDPAVKPVYNLTLSSSAEYNKIDSNKFNKLLSYVEEKKNTEIQKSQELAANSPMTDERTNQETRGGYKSTREKRKLIKRRSLGHIQTKKIAPPQSKSFIETDSYKKDLIIRCGSSLLSYSDQTAARVLKERKRIQEIKGSAEYTDCLSEPPEEQQLAITEGGGPLTSNLEDVEIDSLCYLEEIKWYYNIEATKRYYNYPPDVQLTQSMFIEEIAPTVNESPKNLLVFVQNENNDFLPMKAQDLMDSADAYFVILESRCTKDLKRLKSRAKKEKVIWDSDNWPIDVDFVLGKELYMAENGRIGLCMAPGRKKPKKRHIWKRDLYKDLDRLKDFYGCDVLVTLVRQQELRDLRITDIFEELKQRDMQSLFLPIKDKWIPKSTPKLISLVEKIVVFLKKGKTVVVHCNGGKGRSATVIVATMISMGRSPGEAIKILQQTRKGTIKNPLQQAYLKKYKKKWTDHKKMKYRQSRIKQIKKDLEKEAGMSDPESSDHSPQPQRRVPLTVFDDECEEKELGDSPDFLRHSFGKYPKGAENKVKQSSERISFEGSEIVDFQDNDNDTANPPEPSATSKSLNGSTSDGEDNDNVDNLTNSGESVENPIPADQDTKTLEVSEFVEDSQAGVDNEGIEFEGSAGDSDTFDVSADTSNPSASVDDIPSVDHLSDTDVPTANELNKSDTAPDDKSTNRITNNDEISEEPVNPDNNLTTSNSGVAEAPPSEDNTLDKNPEAVTCEESTSTANKRESTDIENTKVLNKQETQEDISDNKINENQSKITIVTNNNDEHTKPKKNNNKHKKKARGISKSQNSCEHLRRFYVHTNTSDSVIQTKTHTDEHKSQAASKELEPGARHGDTTTNDTEDNNDRGLKAVNNNSKKKATVVVVDGKYEDGQGGENVNNNGETENEPNISKQRSGSNTSLSASDDTPSGLLRRGSGGLEIPDIEFSEDTSDSDEDLSFLVKVQKKIIKYEKKVEKSRAKTAGMEEELAILREAARMEIVRTTKDQQKRHSNPILENTPTTKKKINVVMKASKMISPLKENKNKRGGSRIISKAKKEHSEIVKQIKQEEKHEKQEEKNKLKEQKRKQREENRERKKREREERRELLESEKEAQRMEKESKKKDKKKDDISKKNSA